MIVAAWKKERNRRHRRHNSVGGFAMPAPGAAFLNGFRPLGAFLAARFSHRRKYCNVQRPAIDWECGWNNRREGC
jgi:hypothetical protein